MDGEQESIVEAEAPIDAVEPDEPELAEGEELEAQPEPDEDLEEFDWNGKKIKGPKGLKDGVLMHADYTTKTQAIAATRKELEEQKTKLAQQSQEERKTLGRLARLEDELGEYAKVNWNQLSAEDPIGAQQHWMRYQTAKDEATYLAQELNNLHTQRTQQAQQDTAKRFEQTQEWVKQNIKGWTPEVDAKVLEWAKSKGATNQNLLDAMSPMVYEMLYLARIGEQALKKPTPAPKQPITEPLKVVTAKANPPPAGLDDRLSIDEWNKRRNAQLAKKRG